MKALIVEDEDSMQMVLRLWLERMGYEVQVTDSIELAATIIANTPELELITLDLNLKDSRVNTTIPRIREIRARNPNALLVVISGALTSKDEKMVTEYGADGFMEKQDVPTEKTFFGKLRDVVTSLTRTPRQYARNIPLLESIAAKIAQRCETFQCSIGEVPLGGAKPPEGEVDKTESV